MASESPKIAIFGHQKFILAELQNERYRRQTDGTAIAYSERVHVR